MKTQRALAKNHLEVDHLKEFARRYMALSQESNSLFRFYKGLRKLRSAGTRISELRAWKKELSHYRLQDGERIPRLAVARAIYIR